MLLDFEGYMTRQKPILKCGGPVGGQMGMGIGSTINHKKNLSLDGISNVLYLKQCIDAHPKQWRHIQKLPIYKSLLFSIKVKL